LNYDPGTFTSLAATPLGCSLWAALTNDAYIAAMTTATALGHPAVAGIESELLRDFGHDVLDDRVKQMIGHMVRQIMEQCGFVIDQQKVKIDSIPFYAGTRYKARDDWTYYVWQSSSDQRHTALTADREGQHLPTLKKGRWISQKSFVGALRGKVAYGMKDESEVRRDLARRGFHEYRRDRLLRPA
jgi:hypothetical protein